MHEPKPDDTRANPYDQAFADLTRSGLCDKIAAEAVAEKYLDGKPRTRGKHKISRAERDAAFWTSGFLLRLTPDAWQTEALVLALTRYLGQTRVSNLELLEQVAALAPDTVRQAVRWSGLVLQPHSPRRAEFVRLAVNAPGEFADLVQVLDVFARAHQERVAAVEQARAPLAGLSPLELLVYASLFAFEHLVPADLAGTGLSESGRTHAQAAWDAINDALIWKLSTTPKRSLNLTEADIGRSLATHLSPFLFPALNGQAPRHDLRDAFEKLVAWQMELNGFLSRSADAFSYDDSIRFVLAGNGLEIVELDPAARGAWSRDGRKLDRLHRYWLNRAVDAFAASEIATQTIGRPENHEANRFAYINAMRSQLRLVEVYGADTTVTTDSGESVDLFQALLSLELTSAFFNTDYLAPFALHLAETGHCLEALSRLAINGLVEGFQNRFPLTWSDRTAKIAKITGWTVSADHPKGSRRMAAAILDFWTSDWASLALRLREGAPGLDPELFERPFLKMGPFLFQLPWIVASQNNSTAAINNLRRLGARRTEAGRETGRIERRLGHEFEERGFRVVLNYRPPILGLEDPGEVDVISARDGIVLVLELKSTFLRRSQREAWLHGKTTLRKAGLQLRRKVEAVRDAVAADEALISALAIDSTADAPVIHGWIVDTSIECDHQRFFGFLKVSLEEVLIALRNDRALLDDPAGLLDPRVRPSKQGDRPGDETAVTLYPEGFTAARFVEIVESEAVWDEAATEDTPPETELNVGQQA